MTLAAVLAVVPSWISAFSDPAKSKVAGKMAFTTLPGALFGTPRATELRREQAGARAAGRWFGLPWTASGS